MKPNLSSMIGNPAVRAAFERTDDLPADPVFTRIELHRNAHDDWLAVLKAQGNGALGEGADRLPCHVANDALDDLLDVRASTLAGLAALLTYLDDLSKEEDWVFGECDARPLVAKLAASLRGFAKDN